MGFNVGLTFCFMSLVTIHHCNKENVALRWSLLDQHLVVSISCRFAGCAAVAPLICLQKFIQNLHQVRLNATMADRP